MFRIFPHAFFCYVFAATLSKLSGVSREGCGCGSGFERGREKQNLGLVRQRCISTGFQRFLVSGFSVAIGLLGFKKYRKEKKSKGMEWVQKMLFPMRRFILGIATRVRSRKNGGGLLKLHNDVQMCGYEDVQVMWAMLKKSEVSDSPKRRRPFWRLCMWTSRASSLGRVYGAK